MTEQAIKQKARELGIKYQTPCHGVGDCEFEASQAALEMAEWLLDNLWISVEDELPPFDEVVIVHCDDTLNPNDMMLTHRTNDNDIIIDENNFCTYNEEIITHWMPIPKLNKK